MILTSGQLRDYLQWPDDGARNSRWTQMLTRLREWGYLEQGPTMKGLTLDYNDRHIEVVDFYLLLKNTGMCLPGVPWRKGKVGERMRWVSEFGWPMDGYIGAYEDGSTMEIPPRKEYTNAKQEQGEG